MIVVIGSPAWRPSDPEGPAGRAAAIAIAAAAAGSRVELVGRVGDDKAGDAALLALSRAGVGHAAVLRDPARATPLVTPVGPDPALAEIDADERSVIDLVADRSPEAARDAALDEQHEAPELEPADVSLGLRYLVEFRIAVITDGLPDGILSVATDAAGYAGASLIVLVDGASPVPDGMPSDATVLAVPDDDPDDAFAGLVGAFAAGLDQGLAPGEAFRSLTGSRGWESIGLGS